jgi:glycosyltransferase involved in cell wall biosynthesis
MFDLIGFLKEAGWAVSFVTSNPISYVRQPRMLQQRGVAVYDGTKCDVEQLIANNGFDLAIIAFWPVAELFMPIIRRVSPVTRIIVDSVDLHFLRDARRVFHEINRENSMRLLDDQYAARMAAEVNIYAAADAVFTVSEKEANFINDLVGNPKLAHVVPDSEELMPSTVSLADRRGIVMLGSYKHVPNIQAVQYLCKEILPRLDATIMVEHPVYVVGNGLDEIVRSYGRELPHVRMVGWVPSVLPYFERARVSVIPLLYGAGTKRKMVQALMVGTPTVSTSIGAEGLNLRDGEHVLLGDNPDAFAISIARLLSDELLWRQLARQGRAHIIKTHSRDAARMRFLEAITAVSNNKIKPPLIVERGQKLYQQRVEYEYYQQVMRPVREVVRDVLPCDATVIVVGEGGEELLHLEGREAWPFPQSEGSGPEQLFATGVSGTRDATWIGTGVGFEFRLYSGTTQKRLLATVRVIRKETAFHTETLTADTSGGAAFLVATPHPTSPGDEFGTTTISWSTGDGSWGEVYLSIVRINRTYPADSASAIQELEQLRDKGGEYLLFPSPAFWWLKHYPEFAEYLERRYQAVVQQEAVCLIYDLRDPTMPQHIAALADERPETAAATSNNAHPPDTIQSQIAFDTMTRALSSRATGTGGNNGNSAHLEAQEDNGVRLIAFYLPQFHPIPENDLWWGEGFTEWRNVAKAEPLFQGHYQPHLPTELGFYDLRLAETRQAQAELAKEYGIYGFCYYHYWFNGKRLLERPFNEVLASGKPDFPFCLCWANEPWTRRWDGRDKEVLQPQFYGDDDDLAHINWLLPALRDPRAITIEGKPVFLVYQARDLPNPARTVEVWRQEVRKAGLEGIYLITVETGWDTGWDATEEGFDAKVLFMPQFSMLRTVPSMPIPGKENLQVYDYQKAWTVLANPEPVRYRRYDSVFPSWDNSPRRGDNAVILHNSTPEAYYQWLYRAIERVHDQAVDHRVIFINAWNEWAEGAHLEPDMRFGRAYLEATRRALLTSQITSLIG